MVTHLAGISFTFHTLASDNYNIANTSNMSQCGTISDRPAGIYRRSMLPCLGAWISVSQIELALLLLTLLALQKVQ